MKTEALFLAAAVSLLSLASPSAANAAKHHAKHHVDAPSYPMTADEFRPLAERRIEKVWGVVEKKLDKRNVSPDRKKAMRKTFDEVAREARSEIDKAVADGTVTQAEGDKFKRVALSLRTKFRERLANEKKAAKSEGAATHHAKATRKPAEKAKSGDTDA